jgi:hypothetical protein
MQIIENFIKKTWPWLIAIVFSLVAFTIYNQGIFIVGAFVLAIIGLSWNGRNEQKTTEEENAE